MKKSIILLILILWLFSCWNTKYENLPEDKQKEIQWVAFGITFKGFWKALKWKNVDEKFVEKELLKKYPDVDFGDFSELEKDIKNMKISF